MIQPKVKYPYKNVRWAFFKWADIPSAADESLVYLRRLRILQTPWFMFYLHWIFEPDNDRDPHDHPMSFWSFIVRGGYTEVVYHDLGLAAHGPYRRCLFSLHKMPRTWAHKITDIRPGTVTLLLGGPRRQKWGFWTAQGWARWEDYPGRGIAREDALS